MPRVEPTSLDDHDHDHDHDLVLRVADGDVPAFEALYDHYSARAFSLAMRITGRRDGAEEVTQDAFLALWRTAPRYDPDRGSLSAWLLSMVRYRGIDWRRRAARHDGGVEIDQALAGQLDAGERTEEQVADRDECLRARQLLGCLPRAQRQVIELAYFKGLTQTEIATRAGIPLGTVKGRQRLALTKMREALTSVPTLVVTDDRRTWKDEPTRRAAVPANMIPTWRGRRLTMPKLAPPNAVRRQRELSEPTNHHRLPDRETADV
jgi:RNA polymerase sigma-70 factor (ECF subfamily)